MKVLLIYNAAAVNKRTKKILPEVEALFDEKSIQFELRITDYPEHAVNIVGNADFFQYDGVVAGGGDGTLFEVITDTTKTRTWEKSR